MFLAIFGPFERQLSRGGAPEAPEFAHYFFLYISASKKAWQAQLETMDQFWPPHYTSHNPVRGERGCGAGIDNNFSEFFPSRYKLFFIIEKSRSSLETIGELLVVTTAPMTKRAPLLPQKTSQNMLNQTKSFIVDAQIG